jgi:hypothetical protein
VLTGLAGCEAMKHAYCWIAVRLMSLNRTTRRSPLVPP